MRLPLRFTPPSATLLLLAAVACSDDGSRSIRPDIPVEESHGQSLAAVVHSAHRGPEAVQTLARAVAMALQSVSVRDVVRQAMRDSPMTEHKLVLQEFVGTKAGKQLTARLAETAAVDEQSFRTYLGALPRLDFYMPSREHRLTWRGDADILVTSNVSSTPQTHAFSTEGEEVAINLWAMVPSKHPLLMLQYEEFKSRRINPQPRRPGATIQDSDDGAIGVVSIDIDPQGRARVTDLADVYAAKGGVSVSPNQVCQPDQGSCGTGGGGGGGGGGTGNTYLRRIQTDHVCDNANCSEGNEFEFRARNSAGSTRTLRITDIPSTTSQARNDLLMYGLPGLSNTITVHTVETDISSNDDTWSYVTYNPNFVGDVSLTFGTNGTAWPLKESPCCVGVFDPYRVAETFGW